MKTSFPRIIAAFSCAVAIACNPLEELNQAPELAPLEDGFKTCAALGYAVSIANAAFTGQDLPGNITFQPSHQDGYTSAGIIHVQASSFAPIPFNGHVGDIVIAGLWDEVEGGGVISVVLANIDVLGSKLYGIHTIPVARNPDGKLVAVFGEQDIAITEGNQTFLEIDASRAIFHLELERTNTPPPADALIAIAQNFWHITVDENGKGTHLDDDYIVSGGGQIVEARSQSGGVLYHAMIDCRFAFGECALNPLDGSAFVQNVQAGSVIDLGGVLLDFTGQCNGEAKVTLATGKFATATGKSLTLNWN